ncbi:hypothetical protein CgunFtcFv8_007039 [Champsocephalus gunnari]|uniref:Uncharacterized protein n=1 Tax=Champsocephalus gunnari TaxID=52237 RepID=A0AAN8CGR0_CHAGU|nr:hypothetical protein CgunFtcFv8_007039 [Champsocephalus gunnari]
MPSNSPAAAEPPETPENDTNIDVIEDGADHDSPEEGTPASPRTKRRVGRPGRKRKQLLPVSTIITGFHLPFLSSTPSD